MYCLGLLLCYKGGLESLQKRSHGLQAPNIESVALTEGISASVVGGDGRRLLQGVAGALCAGK